MKLRILTALLFLFAIQSLIAQNPTFDIGASIQYIPSVENTILQPITTGSFQSINDTTQVQTWYDSKQESLKSYNADLGFEVMAGMKFKINNKLSVKTGLGVNVLRLESTEQFLGVVESVLTSIDTVIIAPSTGTTFTNFCDVYLNNPAEFGIKDAIDYQLVNLRIPFIFSYEIMNDQLILNLGGYIQTPLYTSRKSEFLSISRELVNGEHLCTYTKVTDDDKSGGNVSNLQSGLSASVAYKIGRNVSIEAGVLKDLDNMFFISDDPFNREIEDLSPSRFTIGVKYSLTSKSQVELPILE